MLRFFQTTFAAACITVLPGMSISQVDLGDLKIRSAEATTEMDQLREILSTSGPDQAMSALKIVMSEGSVEQKRVALEAGLASTSLPVRRTIVEAFFNSKPVIAFMFDGKKLKKNNAHYFKGYMLERGTLEENQVGRFAYKVGDYMDDKACWAWAVAPTTCMFGITDENIILYLSNGGLSGIGTIGTDGIVRGNVTIPNSATVPYEFAVTF